MHQNNRIGNAVFMQIIYISNNKAPINLTINKWRYINKSLLFWNYMFSISLSHSDSKKDGIYRYNSNSNNSLTHTKNSQRIIYACMIWYTAYSCPASLLVLAFGLADEEGSASACACPAAGFIAGDELLLLLLLLHWMSISGLRARSRDAQAAVESDLLINYIYKEIIKARPIKLQNSSMYKLIIRSDFCFQVVNSLYTFGPILNTQFNSWCGKWEQRVHAYMKTLGKNAQRIKRAAER